MGLHKFHLHGVPLHHDKIICHSCSVTENINNQMSILHINYRPKYISLFGAEKCISNLILNDISGGQNSSMNNYLQRRCNFFTIVIPFVSYLYFPQVSYSIFTTRPQAKISYSLTQRPHPSNADNNAMNQNTEQPFCPDIQLAVMTMERDREIRSLIFITVNYRV